MGRVGRLLVGLGLLALLAGCEEMAYALRNDGQIATVLREGEVKIASVEF